MTRKIGSIMLAPLAAAVLTALVSTASAHDSRNEDDGSAHAGDGKNVQIVNRPQTPAHQYFTDVELLDQTNGSHRFYSDLLEEKVVVITTFFTRCKDSCPIATAKILQLQDHLGERLGKDVHFLSITSDPVHDTPERLSSYAQKLGASPAWHFLTGKKANIHFAHARLGTFGPNSANAELNPGSHGNTIFMGNLRTGLWKKIFGPAVNVDKLVEELDTLLADNQALQADQ